MSDRPQRLHELQTWMLEAICGPHAPSATAVVSDGPRLSALERLDIYRSAYRARLTECLLDDYPVLAATLGQDCFRGLCQEYIDRHPSSSPNLNGFGREMADLCAATERPIPKPFCAELATLEWALVEVTHAAAPLPLDPAELQRVPAEAWASARLVASDALRLLYSTHPVNAHYQAYRVEGRLLPLPLPAASATAVYRRELTLWRMDLTPAMARVLDALLEGQALGQALSLVDVDDSDAAALAEVQGSVMVWFGAWVRSGFFTRLIV